MGVRLATFIKLITIKGNEMLVTTIILLTF